MKTFNKEIDEPLTEDQQKFIDATDFDLNIDTYEESMFNDLTFEEFKNNYQKKHFEKYGTYLIVT